MNILTRYRINDLVEKISTLFIALGVLVISVGAIIGIIYFIVNTANDIRDQNNAVTLSYSDIEDILHQCIRNSVTDFVVERQNGSLVDGYTTNADILVACLDANNLIIKQIKKE